MPEQDAGGVATGRDPEMEQLARILRRMAAGLDQPQPNQATAKGKRRLAGGQLEDVTVDGPFLVILRKTEAKKRGLKAENNPWAYCVWDPMSGEIQCTS